MIEFTLTNERDNTKMVGTDVINWSVDPLMTEMRAYLYQRK